MSVLTEVGEDMTNLSMNPLKLGVSAAYHWPVTVYSEEGQSLNNFTNTLY